MRSAQLAFTALALFLSASLSACGFSPLYGSSGLVEGLSEIQVETGRERADFVLQEALLDGMGARYAAGPYTLHAIANVDTQATGVGVDSIASRYAVTVSVDWQLMRDGNTEPAAVGIARSDASYDVPTGVYGGLAAQANAEDRAIRAAADRLIVQLARALRDQ